MCQALVCCPLVPPGGDCGALGLDLRVEDQDSYGPAFLLVWLMDSLLEWVFFFLTRKDSIIPSFMKDWKLTPEGIQGRQWVSLFLLIAEAGYVAFQGLKFPDFPSWPRMRVRFRNAAIKLEEPSGMKKNNGISGLERLLSG